MLILGESELHFLEENIEGDGFNIVTKSINDLFNDNISKLKNSSENITLPFIVPIPTQSENFYIVVATFAIKKATIYISDKSFKIIQSGNKITIWDKFYIHSEKAIDGWVSSSDNSKADFFHFDKLNENIKIKHISRSSGKQVKFFNTSRIDNRKNRNILVYEIDPIPIGSIVDNFMIYDYDYDNVIESEELKIIKSKSIEKVSSQKSSYGLSDRVFKVVKSMRMSLYYDDGNYDVDLLKSCIEKVKEHNESLLTFTIQNLD